MWDSKEKEEQDMADFYDRDAYNCLVIAILKGVGANKAIRLYWGNHKDLSYQEEMPGESKENSNRKQEEKKNVNTE